MPLSEDFRCWRDDRGNPRTTLDGLSREVLHSPGGYEWGYGGSGPSDLALNILLLHTGDAEYARRWHQELKRDMVAAFPREGDAVPLEALDAWIASHRA